ncbi:MAG: epoxyqueuosine reductase QueH [Ruminococcus sp.]|nr:epoxyqueuosine reductase QueH [Ruminococcus sp.]
MNYSKELEGIIASIGDKKPTLFLHACCAPCSSYVLEYLSSHFDITLYFYNPNISPAEEYNKRLDELKRLVKEMGPDIKIIEGEYNPDEFFEIAKGLENLPEGGERCKKCYRLRLQKTAQLANSLGYDYFCTTLSISPHKNAEWINEIGATLASELDVKFLPSDFKKKNGYKRSIELSREYNLYRQNFCGCVFSKKQAEEKTSTKVN